MSCEFSSIVISFKSSSKRGERWSHPLTWLIHHVNHHTNKNTHLLFSFRVLWRWAISPHDFFQICNLHSCIKWKTLKHPVTWLIHQPNNHMNKNAHLLFFGVLWRWAINPRNFFQFGNLHLCIKWKHWNT
jgi:hypothetical protein